MTIYNSVVIETGNLYQALEWFQDLNHPTHYNIEHYHLFLSFPSFLSLYRLCTIPHSLSAIDISVGLGACGLLSYNYN